MTPQSTEAPAVPRTMSFTVQFTVAGGAPDDIDQASDDLLSALENRTLPDWASVDVIAPIYTEEDYS